MTTGDLLIEVAAKTGLTVLSQMLRDKQELLYNPTINVSTYHVGLYSAKKCLPYIVFQEEAGQTAHSGRTDIALTVWRTLVDI